MSEYNHARRGSGTAVHAIGEGGQLCGAGKNTIGTRRASGLRYTSEPITCQACLKAMGKREPAAAEPERTWGSESPWHGGGGPW